MLLVAAGARGLEAIALVFAARLEVDSGDATSALLRLAEAAQVAPAAGLAWRRRAPVKGHLAMATGATARACESFEASLATSRGVEVGFEALTPAYLAVALARSAESAGAASSAIDGAHRRRERTRREAGESASPRGAGRPRGGGARAGGPEVPATASAASSEVRRALALSGVHALS